MSKAYVVAEITVTDPNAYEEYRKLVLPTVLAFGGQFLVRGGTRIQCEGEDGMHHNQMRTVILEFPSMSIAREWYNSPAYMQAKALRQAASTGRLFMVEGA
jgi:uncharacterized protein (DUF1330 family)